MGNWRAPDGLTRKSANTKKASASPARGQKPAKKKLASPLQRHLMQQRQKHGYGRVVGQGFNVGRTPRFIA